MGLAGLVGAGRSEIARAVFGVDRYDAGTVALDGQAVPAHDPRAAIRAGMAFVPEDRRQQGLVTEALGRAQRRRRDPDAAWPAPGCSPPVPRAAPPRHWAARLEVKTARSTDPATTLSGGNQQKVVHRQVAGHRAELLIIDEPTRGIDVGTKAEVHRLLSELAGEGLAILMISSELPEVLGHGRPGARRMRGPDHRRAQPRRRHARGRHARRDRTP